MGSTFEVSFTVGLTRNTVQNHPDYSNRRIGANDHAASDYTYIDSQGYEVTYIGETRTFYRNTTGAPASNPTGGTFFVDPRPIYSTNSDGSSAVPPAAGSPNSVPGSSPTRTYLVDNSGNLYDGIGKAVYIQRGRGERAGADNQPPANPWSYTRATLSNTANISTADRVANDSALHDYNDEAIGIEFPGTIETVRLKNPSFIFGSITTPGNLGATYTAATSLQERVHVGVGLPSSITLVCEGAQEGSHDIVIWDATNDNDFPIDGVPDANQPRQSITFTLHVTPATTSIENNDTIEPDIQRIAVEDAVEPVYVAPNEHLTFPVDENYRIRYEVVRGSGTLYVGTLEEEHTVPSSVITVHQSSAVYLNTNNGSNEVHVWFAGEDRSAPRATIIFEYRGQPVPTTRTTPTTTTTTTTQTARLAIATSGTGTTRSVVVSAFDTTNTLVTGRQITLSGTALTVSQTVTTGTATEITLPSTAGTYTLFATDPAGAYPQASTTVTVTASALGTLTISPTGTAVNGVQTVSVTARTADGAIPSGAVAITLSGTGFTTTPATILNGSVNAGVRLPTTAGTYTLTVRATGYNPASTLLVVGTTTAPPTTTTTRGPAGEADSVEIDGQRQLSGTVDQAMRLRVRVLDANDNGVSDVRVTFRVLAPGRGTFAGARGNGRAVADQTDRNGYASANLTPSDDGDIIVRVSAAGVRDPVTFIIAVGEAADDPETPTPSRDVAPSRDISPVVHVGAASRPPMLWVDGGAIYALVGASAQKFAPSVDNALNITVAGGKVYWTEKTGESAGTINSANLNGSGVTELTSILAVPMGIVVDTAGSKLYWTNSRGRIQSANLDGSRITNELQDLPSPMDIALGNGNVYWTQGNGSVRVVNLTGQKIVRDISTGSDTPGSLVIGGGKVYWTEKTGDSSGTVNSANLNGTGATQLASILAVPMGIAVDGARSKLYWSNSRGRIQSADLDGSGITNVVSGLGSPGDMVLSNSIAAPAATPTTTPTTASRSKYDVNSDGSVDNTDAGLVADAMGTSNARYDVNGDGTVNFLDLLLVFDNRDAGAAGAPTIVGMKLSAAQIDIIKEQIDLLIATNDRSPAAMRTLIYLQQLLVTARPEKTQLLANYPNPFNPETWIPYELATDTNVRLTIYNTQGVVIRTLQFGHQSAGYYTGRDRAAYWDGRNAFGEQVASGLYFYQLETDEMSLMRKMVILK